MFLIEILKTGFLSSSLLNLTYIIMSTNDFIFTAKVASVIVSYQVAIGVMNIQTRHLQQKMTNIVNTPTK